MSLAAVLLFVLCFHRGQASVTATANVQLHNTTTSIGTLTFFQENANSPVTITGMLNTSSPNSFHGFHVHTIPVFETMPDCDAAAGHYNPYNVSHGARENDITQRHVGDLGNLTNNQNGIIMVNLNDSIIQLYSGNQCITDRTIVLHVLSDDGGVGNASSLITGNAGARLACGLIKVRSNTASTPASIFPLIFSTLIGSMLLII